MSNEELKAYLHDQIPASKTLGIGVKSCSESLIELTAPLDINLNHKNTAFGGSLSVLAILSGWSLVYMQLLGIKNEIVIQESTIKYIKAVTRDFSSTSTFENPALWNRFIRSFERHGKGRITVTSKVFCTGELVATHTGTYVAFNKRVK